jgi:(E)-4-hydroxy-3-methylbut-2-enyl-diphosphate synthase
MYHIKLLEKFDFDQIVLSLKSSNVKTMFDTYMLAAETCKYPLHLGVTEAGTEYNGVVKNSVGIGALLLRGIGDTIRVILSADPVREVVAARAILSSIGKINDSVQIVACPTCGRCEWDCMAFAKEVEDYVSSVKKDIKIAVMGCVVNGPGESSDADLGVAGAKDECAIFVKGKIVSKVKKEKVKEEFFKELDKCLQ